ncbi:hypothetical protein C2S52_009553 [Perilla frutescens var. hirtella]|uniref:Uncharacterized protein n=1 Tax=Perilla frutescens var. hirtella TaxID=608512 RepID=A0AAD4INP2_PERFH|nr:hypothetical protein C2S53_007055 [Perilla frutescens var. hirtella]KAH6760016.1 hypothetical protein C2S51_016965 [Perilla frutescens var. frutescens]KAH6784594.1 hypothetical protein C2S52_009553 [Perilla frutescens var. hirtella]
MGRSVCMSCILQIIVAVMAMIIISNAGKCDAARHLQQSAPPGVPVVFPFPTIPGFPRVIFPPQPSVPVFPFPTIVFPTPPPPPAAH